MQTGIGNQESVAQLLRNVSQRRRHGLLDLRFADSRVHIHFAQGKIVEVSAPGLLPVKEAGNLLLTGGFLVAASDAHSYSQLSEEVRAQNKLSPHEADALVRRAARQGALSRLYALDLSAPAFSNFDSSMVEYEKSFAPSLSIGQLLLDMVALPADKPKFLSLFGGQVLLSQIEKEGLSLSDEEALLHNLLKREQTLQELRCRSMLSEFPLQDGLLRLHEQGLLAVREAPRQEGLREELLGADILTDLDASIDSAFESEGLMASASEMRPPESMIDEPSAPSEPVLAIASAASKAPSLTRGVHQRIAIANMRALHAPWAPALVMIVFLAACALVPLFFWQRVFEAFAG